nr:MAG TPA: hypothetical protein [Caudoviricetes sp.]
MKTILDISNHQKDIKIDDLKGVDGVIYRIAIGTSKLDDCFKGFVAQKNDPIGVYVASYAKNAREAKAEAEYAINACRERGIHPIIFFDWEYFSADYIKSKFGITATADLIHAMTEAFCDTCIDNNYITGVYFNRGFLIRYYKTVFFDNLHPEYRTWYACPGLSAPDFDCDLWQYASNEGTEFGYAGNVDKNKVIKETRIIGNNDIQPMRPLSTSPIRLKIGFASEGDIRTLKTKIEGLGIACVVADGYIITSEVSAGDQCYILTDCNNLNIPCVEYKEGTPKPEPKPEPTPEPEQPPKKKSILELIIDFIFALFEGK